MVCRTYRKKLHSKASVIFAQAYRQQHQQRRQPWSMFSISAVFSGPIIASSPKTIRLRKKGRLIVLRIDATGIDTGDAVTMERMRGFWTRRILGIPTTQIPVAGCDTGRRDGRITLAFGLA